MPLIGPMDISQPGLGPVSTGDSLSACGPAGQNGVISLGDGGSIVLSFEHPIINENGPDFAVFENSFMDTFLEFAFVEVSSDGERFVRFPSICLSDTLNQLDAFGLSNPEKIHNLAGKYRAMYGTPFDLEDLRDSAGIDLMNITQVKLIDVIGCIGNPAWTSRDAEGRKINDPWPTPFPSSGFDLDAVAVLHWNNPSALNDRYAAKQAEIFPQPVLAGQSFRFSKNINEDTITIYNLQGNIITEYTQSESYAAPETAGLYIVRTGEKLVKLLVTE
jgi:hypothetical protein